MIPPALRERHREGLRRYLETGRAAIVGRRVELTGMRADGEEFPIELAVNRIDDADPPMFTGMIRDITTRLQAQKQREEARAQLEAILQGVADAVTAQAPDGRLLFANDAAVAALGFDSTEELLSAPIATILDRFDILDERRPARSRSRRSRAAARSRARTRRRRWCASACGGPARSAGRP